MRLVISFILILSFSYAKWIMFGSNTGEVFLFNDESGETFRYFDQNGNTGFSKQNFYRNLNYKNENANKQTQTQNTQTSTTNTNTNNNNQTDLQKIQNLLLNNGAANPVNLLNGIYQ